MGYIYALTIQFQILNQSQLLKYSNYRRGVLKEPNGHIALNNCMEFQSNIGS
jgi:hypothetical protein